MKHVISRIKIDELIKELEERVDQKNEYMKESVEEAQHDLDYLEKIGLYKKNK